MDQDQIFELANNYGIQQDFSRIALIVIGLIIFLIIICIIKFAGQNNVPQDDDEKINDAVRTINEGAHGIPGLGFVMPIKAPKEKVELDENEIPWELKNEDQNDENAVNK